MFHGRVGVLKENELTPEERKEIQHCALYVTSMAKIREVMNNEFPGRNFDVQLLWRVVNKFCEQHYGKDYHRLPDLVKNGENLLRTLVVFLNMVLIQRHFNSTR